MPVFVVIHSANATAAFMFWLCEETIQMPPPTSPVVAVDCPAHFSGAAAAISPAGILKAVLNRYCPSQDGPTAMSTLLPLKPWSKKPWVETDLPAISGSSKFAIRVQSGEDRSTLRVLPLTSSWAGHWLDQK